MSVGGQTLEMGCEKAVYIMPKPTNLKLDRSAVVWLEYRVYSYSQPVILEMEMLCLSVFQKCAGAQTSVERNLTPYEK